MQITNGYCTLAELKSRISIPDAIDDATLKSIIESVSRLIDTFCNRHFHVETAIWYFTADDFRALQVPDLLSVTTLGLDRNGDHIYEESWAATDYDLLPFNAVYQDPPRPFTEIRVVPTYGRTFPKWQKSVAITGKWGFYEVLEDLDVLGAAIVSTAATTFTATSGVAYSAGQTIIVDSEQMWVRAVSGTTITVKRGVNGTTAATHLIAAPVSVFTYPMVSEACLLQCARIFARRNAPFGIVGNAEMGTLMVLPRLDSDVKMMLDPLRSWGGF